MAKRKTINEKRLTKKQVSDVIAANGILHNEYSKVFEETLFNGRIIKDKVYTLPGEQFLYVFDNQGLLLQGKGDIYPKDYLLRMIKRRQRLQQDAVYKRGSSVSHWRFYSEYTDEIVFHIELLIVALSEKSGIPLKKLDKTYESLDLVSAACERYEPETLFREWYDNLVAYVGEVIRQRVNGNWAINEQFSGGKYPFIHIDLKNVQYMPINVVWTAMDGLEPIDLRKEAANEIRSKASRVKFEREFSNGKI